VVAGSIFGHLVRRGALTSILGGPRWPSSDAPQQGDFSQSLDTDGGKRTLYIYSYENNIYILRLISLSCDIDGGL